MLMTVSAPLKLIQSPQDFLSWTGKRPCFSRALMTSRMLLGALDSGRWRGVSMSGNGDIGMRNAEGWIVGGAGLGGGGALGQVFLVSAEAGVDEEGAEGNEGGDKEEGGAFEGPFGFEPGEEEGEAVKEEEQTVGHSDHTDGEGKVPDVFQGHGDAEEEEEGDAFEDADEAEAANFVSEHGGGGGRLALAGEHEFVAFGVNAHGEVRGFVVLGLGVAGELAAGSEDFGGTSHDVGNLEGEAGPGAFAFSAAVDADGGSGDGDFADEVVVFGDFGSEGFLVEGDGAVPVGGPDGVFDSFDDHGGRVAGMGECGSRNAEVGMRNAEWGVG